MIKSFNEVPDDKLAFFSDLAAGDDDDYCYNSINLKTGVLTFFSSGTRVKPYKDCEVILYE